MQRVAVGARLALTVWLTFWVALSIAAIGDTPPTPEPYSWRVPVFTVLLLGVTAALSALAALTSRE